ncbi:MAG: manganese efflux pump MntP family protein [Cellulosilyticaceae bacterium]
MGFIELIILSFALAMDAFAVSVTNGLSIKKLTQAQVFLMSLAFGLAQGVMPLIGWVAGQTFSTYVSAFDHWIALIILGFIGGKMVIEGYRSLKSPDTEEKKEIVFTFKLICIQAIATSIDALTVGVTFALIEVNIIYAASCIAIITTLCCILGGFIGKRFGVLFKEKAEILGGAILILMGLKIFLQHMF